jgi:hypothetical protein
MRRTLVLLLLVAACGRSDPAMRLEPVSVLPAGKSDLALTAGLYQPPDGFVPELTFRVVGEGWHSTHRDATAFDLGMPDPKRDAPLVALVFAHLPGNPEQAVAGIVGRQPKAQVDPLVRTLANHDATVVDVVDGKGPAFEAGSISLDVSPATHLRVYVTTIDGDTLAAAALVPQNRFLELFPVVGQILDTAWSGPSPTACCMA